MIKPTLILFIFSLSPAIFAQWEFQNPVPTNAELNDIQFVDENHGWAVGAFGTILYSSDGGDSWVVQKSDEGNIPSIHTTLKKVCFTDAENGWVAGTTLINFGGVYGTILHTSNGGNNWESIYSSMGSVAGVCFIDPENGWAAAHDIYGGIILHTTNGGETWEIQYDMASTTIHDICFTDADHGWVVGNEGTIIHTNDGGLNWATQESGVITNLISLCFTDQDNGWATGDVDGWPHNVKILNTTDGGDTWLVNYEFENYFGIDVSSIFFIDSDNGWITYSGYYSWLIFHTSNGGNTWETESPGMHFNSMRSIYFLDEYNGWALGENAIMHSTDGGENWEAQNTVSNSWFNSVSFIDENNGWAAGTRLTGGIPNFHNVIVKTTDGGNSWQENHIGHPYTPMGDIMFLDINHGWAVGGNKIISTFNGGGTWATSYLQDESAHSIHFVNLQTGWVAGEDGMIYKSMDGGEYWDEQISGTEESFYDIFFTDQNNGWAVGDNGIVVHTINGGYDWETQNNLNLNKLYQVHFIDPAHGWAVGDSLTILRTINGGSSWVSQEFNAWTGAFHDVCFIDPYKGWIAGWASGAVYSTNSCIILFTNDGGETWQVQESRPYGQFTSIQFVNESKGCAVGSGGTILHTNNGGLTEIPITENPKSRIEIMAYPNPCSGTAHLRYKIEDRNLVIIDLYTISGIKIKELLNEEMMPGTFEVEVDLGRVPVGVYYCILRTNDGKFATKLIKR